MKPRIILAIMALLCAASMPFAQADEITVGDSMESVRARHGNPQGQMSMGGRTIWLYKDFSVQFDDDKVAEVQSSQFSPSQPQAARQVPRRPAVSQPPRTAAVGGGDTNPPRRATLFEAVDENDRADILRHLRAGADVNQREPPPNGETPLHYAAGWASTETVRLLLENGADINARAIMEDEEIADGTPLHSAVAQRKTATVRLLIERGAMVQAQARWFDPDGLAGGSGITPLHFAAAGGSPEIVRLLLDAGARIDALMSSIFKDASMVQPEMSDDPMMSFAQPDGSIALRDLTPLHVAAMEGHMHVVALLLDRGANIHARTRDGATALVLARELKKPQVERFLMTRMASR